VDNGAMTRHPSQPAPASTAALLAGYLHAAGVRHVFGYPGESVIDFMEAARHRGIQVVSAVREGTAAFMAEAMDCDGARADSPAALEKALEGSAPGRAHPDRRSPRRSGPVRGPVLTSSRARADAGSDSRHSGTARTRSYGVNVPAMPIERHEWDIHVINVGR
jgi:Thiamine pyrophosphate enzyme, N-terminal TPP binding domain